jgi:hypothetical protein
LLRALALLPAASGERQGGKGQDHEPAHGRTIGLLAPPP